MITYSVMATPPTTFNHHRYQHLCQQATAAKAQVVVVTKTVDAPMMAQLATHGVQHVGENRVATALEKQTWLATHPPPVGAQYPNPNQHTAATPLTQDGGTGGRGLDYGQVPYQWHFMGHLQRKKVAKTVGRFALIHSVDSVALAEKLSDANQAAGLVQPVLLQVNQANEAQKHGFTPTALAENFAVMAALPGIQVQGVMAMAPYGVDDAQLAQVFGGVKTLRDRLEDTHQQALPTLSMGMTNDYHVALQHGATFIRIGRALFSV